MLSRKNFYISSKIFFTLISLIMLIPLTFLTIFFDFYSLRLLNREIASANRNALFLSGTVRSRSFPDRNLNGTELGYELELSETKI